MTNTAAGPSILPQGYSGTKSQRTNLWQPMFLNHFLQEANENSHQYLKCVFEICSSLSFNMPFSFLMQHFHSLIKYRKGILWLFFKNIFYSYFPLYISACFLPSPSPLCIYILFLQHSHNRNILTLQVQAMRENPVSYWQGMVHGFIEGLL